MVVSDDDEVLMINSDGIIIRIKASDVSRLGRATQGVRIMKVGEDANIVSIARVIKDDEADGSIEPAASGEGGTADEKENSAEDDSQIRITLE